MKYSNAIISCLFVFAFSISNLYSQNINVENAQRYDRLLIKNVKLIDGKGTPMRGPNDVIIENNKIASITRPRTKENAIPMFNSSSS